MFCLSATLTVSPILQTNVHVHLLKNGEICTVHRENSVENNKLAVLHGLFQGCHSLVISPFKQNVS